MGDETKPTPAPAPARTAAQIREDAIRAKIRAGLTRDEAIDVIDRQTAWDKEQTRK